MLIVKHRVDWNSDNSDNSAVFGALIRNTEEEPNKATDVTDLTMSAR